MTMMQQPPTGGGGGAVHPSWMMVDQQKQHQPQPTTTSTAEEEEEEEEEDDEEEFRRLWIGDFENWMDKVEEKEVRTLWIGDLQPWMDGAYIDNCFARTGEVFTSKVIRKCKSDQCYGIIEFKSHAIAERFLRKFNGTPMTRAPGSSFSLNWASSSFGSGGEKQQQQRQEEEEEEDDNADDEYLTMCVVGDDGDDLAAASDIVTTDFMLPQETFTLDCATQFYNEKVYSSWEDLLKWWSIAQRTKGSRTPQAVHATHRVYMIGAILKNRYPVPPATIIEELLDELPRYVDSIDIAKELHSIDALDPFLSNLYSEDAGIRAKAAKVMGTIRAIPSHFVGSLGPATCRSYHGPFLVTTIPSIKAM